MSGMPSLVGAPILPGQQKLASASASRSGGFALDPLDTLDLGYDEEEEEIDDYDLARVSDEKKLSSGSKKKDKDKQGKKLAKADKDKKVKKKDKADKKRSHSGGETTTTTTGRSSSSKKSKTSGKDTKKKKPQQQQQQQPQKHQQRQTTGDQDTDTYSEDFAAQSNGSDEYTDQFAHDEPAPVVSQGGVKSGHASPRQSASLEAERKREEAAAYERKRLEWEARLRQQQQQQHGQEDETKQLKQRQSALAAAASSSEGVSDGDLIPEVSAIPRQTIQSDTPGAGGKPPVSPRVHSLAAKSEADAYKSDRTPNRDHAALSGRESDRRNEDTKGDGARDYREQRDEERWRWQREQRRQRRALERRKQQLLADEEVAASALMKRLAHDVKGIFQELNLSIVAAERDRHQKEERYRRDREARDRQYEQEKEAREEREILERKAREDRFWAALEEQDSNRRLREKVEAEQKVREEDEDRRMRLDREQSHAETLSKLERERREREDAGFREREHASYKSQLEAYQVASRQQTEELQLRMQSELKHLSELKRIELSNMEARHAEALKQHKQQHDQSLELFATHQVTAEKLQQLLHEVRDSVGAVSSLHEKAHDHQDDLLQQKEQHIKQQMLAQTALQHQLEEQREALEKERHRVTSLCSRFEGSIATFSERHQEELRNLQESQARANTLRDIVEQQRMQHAKEVHKEMLALESRRSELDEERYKWLQEVQQQRLDLSKEKNELTRLMERVRIEERDAHDTKIAAQEATSEMSAERQELNEKRKFTESEYRRLEEYRAEATRRFEEEAGVVEREKRRLELVMAKVEEESERALQLRRDAAADRQFIEQTKQQFEVQKRSQDEERRDLNAIKKRIDFEKSQRPSLPPRKGDGDRRVALRAVGNHPKGPFKDVIPSAFQKLHVDPENIAVGPQYLGITGRTSPLVPRAGGLSLIGSTSAANEEDDIVQEQRSFLLSLASPEDFA